MDLCSEQPAEAGAEWLATRPGRVEVGDFCDVLIATLQKSSRQRDKQLLRSSRFVPGPELTMMSSILPVYGNMAESTSASRSGTSYRCCLCNTTVSVERKRKMLTFVVPSG